MQLLDNNDFNDNDLMELRIPINLPYHSSWSNYERIDGEIEFNGMYYNYVKRKVCNDTLYLLCLPNSNKTKLYAAQNDYTKQTNDIPADNKSGSSNKKVNIINEYSQKMHEYNFTTLLLPINQHIFRFASPLPNSISSENFHPPESIA